MNEKHFYVYIMSNEKRGVLYIGVTSNLLRRIQEHKQGLFEGFTKKYNLHNLVYFEQGENAFGAIAREKQLKAWHRNWKTNLIEEENPEWKDLSLDLDPETSSG